MHPSQPAAAARPDAAVVFAGVKNTKRLANSSTVGSSSRSRRGFWRTDSQTQTCDSDLRSLISIDDTNELVRALPIEA